VHVGHERSIKHSVWLHEVGLDLGRVPLAMEMDEAFNPAEVRMLGARAVLF
jgi:hypothetical protein